MSKFFTSIAFLLLLVTQIVSGQVTDSTKVIALDEVVITAQFKPQSEKNAIYKVKVLNSKIIDVKAANNLRELLQQELNINMSQSSVFGSSTELQGISKENIRILIDGTPVIGRLNGVLDLSQINLQNIERIEIIEGPVSVFYGTDAMGGVINLISKKTQNKKIEGNASLYYETIDATTINGNIGYKYGDNLIKLDLGTYQFGGLSTNGLPRSLNWEEKNQTFANFMYGSTYKNLDIRLNNNFSNEKLISIGEPDRRGNIKDSYYYTRRIDNYVNLKGEISNNKFVDITLSYLDYQRYHDTFVIDPVTFSSTKSTNDNKDDNLVKLNYAGVKAQLGKSNFEDKVNYAYGTDINYESSEGSRILDNKQSVTSIIFYSSVNYKIQNNFEIQPAIRYTYNSSYGSLISPAFNSKFKINNEQTIRFSYAKGFRAPSLKELFLDFHISAGPLTYIISGNKNLEVENSNSFNLQYSFSRNLGTYSSISIEPSLFYNDITNLISLSELVDFKRHYININNFKSLGGKLEVFYQPSKTFSIKTGVSITGRYNKFNESFNATKYLYSPEFVSSINYQFVKPTINLNIFYKFSGKREGFFIDNTDDLVKTTRGSFSNLDATLSKSFFNNSLKTAIGVKNAFDVEDIETINESGQAHARDMQLWGRSFFIKTTFQF